MQINRLFEIIYLLLDKKNATAKELAAHFEVSSRTIYRDIEILSAAGIPVFMTKGKGGGISLLPNFVLNKTVLTEEERAEILSALHAVDALSLDKADTAVNKLSTMFGNHDADWIEVDFSSWYNADEEILVFNTVKSAIVSKQCIEFLYHGGNGTSTQRIIEPLKLCFKGQSWYLYGYCLKRQDYRFFKLRRIKKLMTLDETFVRTTPNKVFTGQKIFQDEFVKIKLKLSKNVAFRVYDEFEQYEQQEDGSFIAEITMPGDNWVYCYLSTFGEDCEVLEPAYIRLQVKEKLEKTLKHYL